MTEQQQQTRTTVGKLTLVAIAMFGFGFLMWPLYNVMCDAFGINGRFTDIQNGEVNTEALRKKGKAIAKKVDKTRKVTVQFLASRNENLNWEFRPLQRKIVLHPGEIQEVRYFARNLTGRDVVAQAVPSVSPGKATKYFTKMECFCFTKQTLKPGEAKEMPLRFIVDPGLPKEVSTISLAYTFFDTENRRTQAKASTATNRQYASLEEAK